MFLPRKLVHLARPKNFNEVTDVRITQAAYVNFVPNKSMFSAYFSTNFTTYNIL